MVVFSLSRFPHNLEVLGLIPAITKYFFIGMRHSDVFVGSTECAWMTSQLRLNFQASLAVHRAEDITADL